MVFLVGIFAGGCRRSSQEYWAGVYTDAFAKSNRHERARISESVEAGFRNTPPNSVLNYQFRLLKARLLINADRPEAALQLLKASPPEKHAELSAIRTTFQSLATARLGDLETARIYIDKAMELAAVAPDVLPRVFASRAYLAELQKDAIAAETYYRKAAELAGSANQPWLEADSLVNVARFEMSDELYDEAIQDLSKSLEESRAGNSGVAEQLSLGKIGWSYFQIGDFDQAISFLTQAEATAGRIGETMDQARWSIDLGTVYFRNGDYEKADQWFSHGKSLAQGSHDQSGIVAALNELARTQLARNDIQKAQGYNQQALAAETGLSDAFQHSRCLLTSAEILMHRQQFSDAEKLLQSLTAYADDASLMWTVHSDLAKIRMAEGKSIEAEHEFQAGIHIVETSRNKLKQEEHRMSILDAGAFYDDYIRFLVRESRFPKALQIAEFSRARTLAEGLGIAGPQTADISIQRIQHSLQGTNRVVLAYWLAKDESYLWAITSSQFQYYTLPPEHEIQAEIQAYSEKLLRHQGIEDSAEGQKLYQWLVRPAEKMIPKGSRVIVIPNLDLYTLNFETLVAPGNKPHYWIEDVTVEIAGSMALLAAPNHPKARISEKMLLIGAPVKADDQFPVLTHADEEIKRVAAHFSNAGEKVISGQDATPASYRRFDPGTFRLIHFVTHGTASKTSPLDSAIILSPQLDKAFKLYARDIMQVPLNADVVTISACYGAGTRTYSGEGLVGLAWGFLRAGAHQVIAGLWQVDDRATPELMDDFYGNLAHESAPAALREAKLRMLAKGGVYGRPYYWGSLQVYTGW
jgi:CHAT domain-containing protein/Tfp pilus assembly protein PilF